MFLYYRAIHYCSPCNIRMTVARVSCNARVCDAYVICVYTKGQRSLREVQLWMQERARRSGVARGGAAFVFWQHVDTTFPPSARKRQLPKRFIAEARERGTIIVVNLARVTFESSPLLLFFSSNPRYRRLVIVYCPAFKEIDIVLI